MHIFLWKTVIFFQHRILQEGFAFKEAELREAQNWIGSVQMEALQSAANQALQAELRERSEQFNQYWAYLVRQVIFITQFNLCCKV